MTKFTPTAEQQTIITAAQTTDDNMLISALAGAAKTSTLVLIAEALPKVEMLCLAFNKRIAVEMQERLPANCEAMTLNSLGHRAWSDSIGRRLIVDTKKNYNVLKKQIEKLSDADKSEAWDLFAETLRAIAFAKSCGYVPDGKFERNKRLMNDDKFFAHMEDAPTVVQEKLIRAVMTESIKRAFEGEIDFDDQILMPTVFSASFPRFPLVLIDEAQDLSALNHAMLRKLARKRLIAVGDECQAIYGFRGAHEDSMQLLKQEFSMKEYILSISFRCPKSVVNEALWRAPHMKYPEWAVEGSVSRTESWNAKNLPESAVIICRNNAPLFATAIKLLKNNRYPKLMGNDIGKTLVKIMKKFGDSNMDKDAVHGALDLWVEERLRRSRDEDKVYDQAACMAIFIDQAEDLGGAIAYAEHLFNMSGPIQLMTGHKAKGLEFDDVYFLDEYLVRNRGQDLNLRYVIITRAMQTLTYINSDQFIDEAKQVEETADVRPSF